uniref:Link domain-containing protein n=1 Tax=viral metagenome TaxID=1070528 RepID=A0A6C0CHT7_9ZZZZ
MDSTTTSSTPFYGDVGTATTVADTQTPPAFAPPPGFTIPSLNDLFPSSGTAPPPAADNGSSRSSTSPPPAAASGSPSSTTTTISGSSLPTTLMIGGVALVLLTVVTFVSTGSFLASLVVLTLALGTIAVLTKLGFIQVDVSNGGLKVGFYELAVQPSSPPTGISTASSVQPPEVFYVGGNDYTYDESAAVCAAYGADLATYDQVTQAYNMGAEWCAYGWTQGGMALYPTQPSTWATLQQDAVAKTSCGRPGVNGGYFDPATKFGVNCYGQKPVDNTNAKYPLPLPGTDKSAFDAMVQKFKSMTNTMPVNSFNRSGWSAWNLSSH